MTATVNPKPGPAEGPGEPRPAFERVAAAWLAREVDGGQRVDAAEFAAELRGDHRRLDPAELARQAGVTTTAARQWLHTLRAARHGDPTLAELRGEPAEH